jgi:hypothetical protein
MLLAAYLTGVLRGGNWRVVSTAQKYQVEAHIMLHGPVSAAVLVLPRSFSDTSPAITSTISRRNLPRSKGDGITNSRQVKC